MTSTCYESVVQCTCTAAVKTTKRAKYICSQEDGGLPLEDYELIGVLIPKLVDELDEVTVDTDLGAQVRQLVLGLDVVDANIALLQ